MSTYTSSLGLELITPGSQAGLWGNTTNNTFTLIDQAVTGVTPISFASASGSTYTLTDYNGAADEARSAVLNITGTAIGANYVVIPNKQKTYLVRNNTGKDVTFQTAVPTATYTVGAGYSILIFCDGNNNVFTGIASPSVGTLSVAGGGTGATTFGTGGFIKSTGGTSALTVASKVVLTTDVSGTLPVANGGTGVATIPLYGIVIGAGTSAVTTIAPGTTGQVLTSNGTNWYAATPSGGVTSVTASLPLASSGGATPNISISGQIGIANGGTGLSTFGSGGFVKSPGGTSNLTTASFIALGSDVSGTLPVANGGTGATLLTSGALLVGAGTTAVSTISPGTSGNILSSNGIAWQSVAPAFVTSVSGSSPISVSAGLTPTVSLSTSGVVAASYTSANITVDAYGRITAASNGGGAGVNTFSAGTTGLTPATATSGAITLGGTLAISNGGTGASTAAGALTALGAYAASNPNGYITSSGTAANVSGTVAILHGGTGATTAAAALTNLGAYAASNPSGYITSSGTAANVSGTVAIGNGGTGATTAAAALLNLGAYAASNPSGYITSTTTIGVAYGGTGATSTTGTGSNVLNTSPTFTTQITSPIYNFDGSGTRWNYSTGAIVGDIGGAARIQIAATGCYNPTGVWGTISDINAKENIVPARNYLADINKVNVVKYSLKANHETEATKLGVIAQELETIFPSMVDTSQDGVKSVKMSVFIPMLIKAVQELSAEVDALKAAK